MSKSAVVLLSGGIDSTVTLAMALNQNIRCLAVSFDYGQKHRVELEHAKAITSHYQVEHVIIQLDPRPLAKSPLTGMGSGPQNRSLEEISEQTISPFYVPARNILFLSYALALCEGRNADEIHFGPTKMDAGFPDCTPAFLHSFQQVMNTGIKQAKEGKPPRLVTPLLTLDKIDIVRKGIKLKVPFELTFSCYHPTPAGLACNTCDACILRNHALHECGVSVNR